MIARVKRLRCLLDLFGRLIAAPADILGLSKRLKGLQVALGDYNDTVTGRIHPGRPMRIRARGQDLTCTC